jgi:hypothetical protein
LQSLHRGRYGRPNEELNHRNRGQRCVRLTVNGSPCGRYGDASAASDAAEARRLLKPVHVPDRLKPLDGWFTFAGSALVVGILCWAQAVLVPVCLAILLTFVLTPPVIWLQRRIGRVAAVLTVVTVVVTLLGLAGYAAYRQMSSMSNELPTYGANIRTKIHDAKSMGS